MITYAEVKADLESIVNDFGPDHVYAADPEGDGPAYFHGDAPGCGVGHWFARRGYLAGHLEAVNEQTGANHAIGFLGIEMESKAIELLRYFQYYQDEGMPWGDALKSAVSNFSE